MEIDNLELMECSITFGLPSVSFFSSNLHNLDKKKHDIPKESAKGPPPRRKEEEGGVEGAAAAAARGGKGEGGGWIRYLDRSWK